MDLSRHHPIVAEGASAVYSVFKWATTLRGFIETKIQRMKHTEWRIVLMNVQ